MKKQLFRFTIIFVLLGLLVGVWAIRSLDVPAVAAAGVGQRQEAGKVYNFNAESPHPAPLDWSQTYTFPEAKFIRLHFSGFNLAQGDRLVISNPEGSQAWEYTGRGLHGNGDFWSFAIDGDTVKVEVSAPSGKSYGFRIIEVGYGTVDLNKDTVIPEIVVGDEGREAIACHLDDTVIAAAQSPVARLLFTVKRSQYLCTGELIQGSNSNTLITNAHCMDNQTEVSTLEARFNYQYTTCGGTTLAVATSYAGGTFLKTNSERYNARKPGTGLDYTLLTLQGAPESVFGELIPTSLDTTVGTEMNFIQHPAGRPKEIGYWEDAGQTIRCHIATVGQTYGTAFPYSQIGYGCDSEGGSSGSAITRASDGKVIGLHHYGGVTPELNSATMMSFICADAGGLLLCDDN